MYTPADMPCIKGNDVIESATCTYIHPQFRDWTHTVQEPMYACTLYMYIPQWWSLKLRFSTLLELFRSSLYKMAAKIISIQSTMLVILKQRDLLDNEEGEREREREHTLNWSASWLRLEACSGHRWSEGSGIKNQESGIRNQESGISIEESGVWAKWKLAWYERKEKPTQLTFLLVTRCLLLIVENENCW